MSSPAKRLKLSATALLLEDWLETETFSWEEHYYFFLFLLKCGTNRSINLNSATVAILYREEHTRISLFSELWIDQYLEHDFFSFFRMKRSTFHSLLNVIELNRVQFKAHKHGRVEVPVKKQLEMTIWYLAKGETLISIADRFNVTLSTTHKSIGAVLSSLINLMPKVIRWPDSHELADLSREFEERGGYPGVIGAIDGSHIAIKAPADQHDSYQNRCFYHSIILQGVCTASLIFTNIFVGFPGSANDARVFKNSSLYQNIEASGTTNFFGENDNYHLLGDSAYILLTWLMKPYEENRGDYGRRQRLHNKILSRTRVVIENAFGLLKGRWRILKFVNVYTIKRAVKIVTASCILHNFCLFNGDFFDDYEEDKSNQDEYQYSQDESQAAGRAKRVQICNFLVNKYSNIS